MRVFAATNDRRLIAIDGTNGNRCSDFGVNGEVVIPVDRPLLDYGEVQISSAPAIVGDVVIVGSAISDNQRVAAPAGTVHAFDARTGVLRWTFDPIPRSFDPIASPTWQGDSAANTGHANVWGLISADPATDLVFLATSSPSADFYGGTRLGNNLYANSIVALRARTAERVRHFQIVRHDLWDYDLPAGPSFVSVERDGRQIDALVQPTKMGFLFDFDRATGTPLFPIEDRPVPKSDVPGELAAPTQPIPNLPPPLAIQRVTPDEAWGVAWFDRRECRERFASARGAGLYTPPSERGTLLAPFTGGGTNWGGISIDPNRRLAIAKVNNLVHQITLVPADKLNAARDAEADAETSRQRGAPFGMKREAMLSSLGLPCNRPPWGTLSAVDLQTGRLLWQRPLGNTRKLAPLGIRLETGTPNLGGSLVTAGGLIFIGATMNERLRAFDVETGAELWAAELPAAGSATPMTYAVSGRQFVVITAGGHPDLDPLGESLVALFTNMVGCSVTARPSRRIC